MSWTLGVPSPRYTLCCGSPAEVDPRNITERRYDPRLRDRTDRKVAVVDCHVELPQTWHHSRDRALLCLTRWRREEVVRHDRFVFMNDAHVTEPLRTLCPVRGQSAPLLEKRRALSQKSHSFECRLRRVEIFCCPVPFVVCCCAICLGMCILLIHLPSSARISYDA